MRGLLLDTSQAWTTYERQRIIKEAKKLHQKVTVGYYQDFSFSFQKLKMKVFLKGKEFSPDYDWCVTRESSDKTGLAYGDVKTALITWLFQSNVRVLNSSSLISHVLLSKFIQQVIMCNSNIPCVESLLVGNYFSFDWQSPYIIKKSISSMGRNVHMVLDVNMKEKIEAKYPSQKRLYQRYIAGGEDLRIMVVGNEVLGAIKRKAVGSDFITNIDHGGCAELYEIDSGIAKIALQTMQAFGLDYGGVDMIFDNKTKQWLVLEVNRHAHFHGFEAVTGINVAKKIVEYLIQ